ncbi:5-demethoxyubiquinol-8 5-hydroxylase UbiM [Pseudoteredinibacter isoporae]|uniref:5-demethoxyubiquinol-8 5-hydroxylase UbiM n=1 Tax=Pseudoteredinibacter isoporae TaxID=570281 RepID=UPI00310B0305
MSTHSRATPQSDIAIVGAGPTGLSLACMLADTGLKITLIDTLSHEQLAQPQMDGRDIALNHASKELLQGMGAWSRIEEQHIHPLNEARVENGHSPLALEFRQPHPTDEPLGYLIANHRLRKSLFEQASTSGNIELFTNTELQSVEPQSHGVQLILPENNTLSCRLLVAADSRFSSTRKMMGIGARMKDYGRTMIVCNMRHEVDHQHTAQECFHYGHTCAILPLGPNESSIVITVNAAKAQELRQLDAQAFTHVAMNMLNGRLGNMTLASERYFYPLIGSYADHFVSSSFALVGDAAVGMHPVTAHGFNLGLHSAQILSKHIKRAQKHQRNIAHPRVLKSYALEHQLMAKPIYEATNLIVKLFNDERQSAKILRKTALGLASHIGPFKKLISHRLTRHAESQGFL